ncbi:unnamed protein product [Leuciscus chuanchicus]
MVISATCLITTLRGGSYEALAQQQYSAGQVSQWILGSCCLALWDYRQAKAVIDSRHGLSSCSLCCVLIMALMVLHLPSDDGGPGCSTVLFLLDPSPLTSLSNHTSRTAESMGSVVSLRCLILLSGLEKWSVTYPCSACGVLVRIQAPKAINKTSINTDFSASVFACISAWSRSGEGRCLKVVVTYLQFQRLMMEWIQVLYEPQGHQTNSVSPSE